MFSLFNSRWSCTISIKRKWKTVTSGSRDACPNWRPGLRTLGLSRNHGHGERVAATGRAFRSLSLYWDSRGWT